MTGRILIADGQATNRITLKVRLMAACYNMQTVSAADQLLSQAADWAPQLVIIGSGVPGASGIALCKELRASPQGAALPVLLMAEASETSAALRAGASAVLDPRCDDMLLMARVRSLLRRGQNDMAADRSEPLTGLAATTIPASVTLVADFGGAGAVLETYAGRWSAGSVSGPAPNRPCRQRRGNRRRNYT